MSKASGRALFVVAILSLLIILTGVVIFGPDTGATVRVEEAGLFGVLFSCLTAISAYYLKG